MSAPRLDRAARPRRIARGATSLLAVLFLLTVVTALLATVLAMTSSDIIDSSVQGDSVKALLLADSGIERAASEFEKSGHACDNAGVGAGATQYALGDGSFTVDRGIALNFAGAALPVDRCQVRATGRVGNGVARTVEAIVERNGNALPPSANGNFNSPPGVCTPPCEPDNWDLTAILPPSRDIPANRFTPWDDINPSPGTGTDRTAYVKKAWNGPDAATGAGNYTFSPPIVVTAPTTVTVTFDYWVIAGSSPKEADFIFRVGDGTTTWSSALAEVSGSGTWSGTWNTMSLNISITGTGAVNLSVISFNIGLKPGQPKEAWLDNIVLKGQGGTGVTRVLSWREPVN